MTAIFIPEGNLFRATELAGGPWSPDMLQGSATTGLMVREVERLAVASGFAARRLTFDLWRPAGLRAFGLATDMLRDGRKVGTFVASEVDDDRLAELMTGESIMHQVTARPLRGCQ